MAEKKDSKAVFQQKAWYGNISNFLKEPQQNPINYWYSECIDTRTDPYALTLHAATQKESGNIVTDFLKFADTTPLSLTTYATGDTGNVYARSSAGSWSLLAQMASAHGNGLGYFFGDDYVYVAGDSTIGRYGPTASSPTFTSDFLTAQGGVPQNTYSLALVSASSQSADAADSASLSITSDLTLEAYAYFNTLPAAGSSMTLIGKWDESGTLRSYIMDVYGVSGYFGDGSDGSLTISADTTEAPIDSACTGTAASYTLSATNASFAIGQRIMIHQTVGTNAGQWEKNTISGYTAGTITLQTPLVGTYVSGAQVRVLKQYSSVTINSGKTYTAKAWNGTVGGILAFLCSGTVTGTGIISANATGYRGGSPQGQSGTPHGDDQGEGQSGVGTQSTAANGMGGGGGNGGSGKAGGGGGGYATGGANGGNDGATAAGVGGGTYGSSDLTTMTFGGGGGAGGADADESGGTGGNGGGIVFIAGVTVTISGGVQANGGNGTTVAGGGGGGGAGGSVLIKAQTATLGAALITATRGSAGTSTSGAGNGGDGGDGRIHLDYYTSYTGTTSPTLDVIQDNSLLTNTTYQARIGISQNGTASEYLTKNLPTLATGQWNRISISWTASSSLATFYLNGSSLGTTTGTKTAIHDNTSLLYVGGNKGASAIQNYLNGYIDDVRIWSTVRSASDIAAANNIQLTGNEGNLAAYYKLNNSAADSGTHTNTLTLRNSPAYTTTVPFVDPTTRLDIDQSYTTTGSTYAVPTAISEVAADQLPFTPAVDPQKSMDIKIAGKGTGDWTITIHDQQNRTIASKTITSANMASGGFQEFTWSTPWRIVIGKSYHAHITSTINDGTIVTSSSNILQTGGSAVADFHTYFQFLVTDTQFHPILRMLNFMVIGNERYLAKWDGAFYTPNLIAFPPGTHVRCLGYWGKYIVAGTWQEPTSGTPNIYDFPVGRLYFWDGISLTFNFSTAVPEGQVNALFGMDANLYYIAGYKLDLMVYGESYYAESDMSQGQKVKRNPYLERTKYAEVYPGAMTMWGGLLRVGMAANTNSSVLPQGVYSWGTLYPQYPESLTFDYIISTGNNSSTVKIGLLHPVGQKLLVGWKDGIAYGADVIDPTGSVYYTSGLIQTNIQDGGEIWRNDNLLKVRADHLALATGEGVTVGYKADRGTSFTTSTSVTDSVTKKFTSETLSSGRLTEYQLQAALSGNGSSSPTLLSIAALVDGLDTEEQF